MRHKEDELFQSFHPHSEDAVKALAVACQQRFQTDHAIAVGPFPESSSEGEPGQLQLALASGATLDSKPFPFTGHPDILKARSAKQALNLLRLRLLGND